MEIIKVKKDHIIAGKKEKVKDWYLIQEGSVIQKFGFSELKLSRNAIIGILERDRFLCEYIAAEDTVLAALTCENSEDLRRIFSGNEKIRSIFLKAAIEQRHQMLSLYTDLNQKAAQFHKFVENEYDEYKNLCNSLRIDEINFSKIDYFKPLVMQHVAENWEVNNSISLVQKYLKEYLLLMEKDDGLTVGVIMEAAAQMRRVTLGIGELETYLLYNKDILINETENDILSLFFYLAVNAYVKKFDIAPILEKIDVITQFAEKMEIYNKSLIIRRAAKYKSYDFSNVEVSNDVSGNVDNRNVRKEIDITSENCIVHILVYAGYKDEEIDSIYNTIESYRRLPDMLATDSETYGLRRKITAIFYDIYYRVFMRSVKEEGSLTPVLEMFLNFGFMDVSFVGEENANALYDLTAHQSIYTRYMNGLNVYIEEKKNLQRMNLI